MSDEQVQMTLIDELQQALSEVKEKYDGDFDKAIKAAEVNLGRMREAARIAGVKTERKPRRRRAPKPSQEA